MLHLAVYQQQVTPTAFEGLAERFVGPGMSRLQLILCLLGRLSHSTTLLNPNETRDCAPV